MLYDSFSDVGACRGNPPKQAKIPKILIPQAFCCISIMSDITKKQHEQEEVQKLRIALTKTIFVQKSAPNWRLKSGKPTVTVFKP